MNDNSWVSAKKFEGLYEISRQGIVRSLHKRNFQKIMPQRVDRAGYYTVRLSRKGKDSTVLVHRLLALAFIDNPDAKPCVNHLDGNKLNNQLDNLEWVTYSENSKHAYATGLAKKPESLCKRVIDICSKQVFKSISEAAKAYGIPYSTCKNFLLGRRENKTCLRLVA